MEAQGLIEDNTIRKNNGYGIAVGKGSTADIFGNVIKDNGDAADFHCGIGVYWSSHAFGRDNLIKDNAYCGVTAGQQSFYRNGFFQNEDPSKIDVIDQTAGGTLAVDVYRGGLAEFRNASIAGKSVISGRSIMEIRNSTYDGDIELFDDSALRVGNEVTGSGQIICSWGIAYGGYSCGNTINP